MKVDLINSIHHSITIFRFSESPTSQESRREFSSPPSFLTFWWGQRFHQLVSEQLGLAPHLYIIPSLSCRVRCCPSTSAPVFLSLPASVYPSTSLPPPYSSSLLITCPSHFTKTTDGDVELLASKTNYFVSVSQHLPRLDRNNEAFDVDGQLPDEYVIDITTTLQALRQVKTNKATGPDYVPAWILKNHANILAGHMSAIFNSS